jgi:phospholipase C
MNFGKMNGFVSATVDVSSSQDPTNPISMFTPETAPIINTLASEFAVFDRNFASVPSSTDPNRAYAMSGTSNGVTENFNGTLWSQQSHIDFLNERGVTAGGYYQDDLWALGYFQDFHSDRNAKRIKEMDYFFADLADDKLPQYTWLQPRCGVHDDKLPSWQHPDARLSLGEVLIKDVYEAVRASPKWNETLLVVTYDEHGGFYDHVYPPPTVSPDGIDTDAGYKFDQLGLRVPMIAISPWINKGIVFNEGTGDTEFDHTSLIRTVNEIFGVDEFMTERDAWAKSFKDVVTDKMRTDTPETLPKVYGLLGAGEETEAELVKQRKKVINEHLEGQILMYCKMHYENEFKEGEICESAKDAARDQEHASKWLAAEQAKMFERMGRTRSGLQRATDTK